MNNKFNIGDKVYVEDTFGTPLVKNKTYVIIDIGQNNVNECFYKISDSESLKSSDIYYRETRFVSCDIVRIKNIEEKDIRDLVTGE